MASWMSDQNLAYHSAEVNKRGMDGDPSGDAACPVGAADNALPITVNPVVSALPITISWAYVDAVDAALLAEWRALSERAGEANIFAEPTLLIAALRHCDRGSGRGSDSPGAAQLAVARDATGTLVGLMPLVRAPRFGRLPLPALSNWGHPNAFLNAITIAHGAEEAFWCAIIQSASQTRLTAPLLHITQLPQDGPVHRGLLSAAGAFNLPVVIDDAVTRAALATNDSADAYWDDSVRAKKRKELRRQWARLSEQGVLTTDHLGKMDDPTPWIAEFLTLEASGWKGTNGSSLSSNADTDAFFNEAMRAAHAAGQLELTALRIDGRAIAMLITLVGGNCGFSFKTAFDEGFARFSPGVLLQRESLGLLVDRKLHWIDSCAAQDHPMIDSLWRERRQIVSVVLPMPGLANRTLFTALQTAKSLWYRVKSLRRTAETPPQANAEADDK